MELPGKERGSAASSLSSAEMMTPATTSSSVFADRELGQKRKCDLQEEPMEKVIRQQQCGIIIQEVADEDDKVTGTQMAVDKDQGFTNISLAAIIEEVLNADESLLPGLVSSESAAGEVRGGVYIEEPTDSSEKRAEDCDCVVFLLDEQEHTTAVGAPEFSTPQPGTGSEFQPLQKPPEPVPTSTTNEKAANEPSSDAAAALAHEISSFEQHEQHMPLKKRRKRGGGWGGGKRALTPVAVAGPCGIGAASDPPAAVADPNTAAAAAAAGGGGAANMTINSNSPEIMQQPESQVMPGDESLTVLDPHTSTRLVTVGQYSPRDWHSIDEHKWIREGLLRSVAAHIASQTPADDPDYKERVSGVSKLLELELYISADSLAVYSDPRTLKHRLKELAAVIVKVTSPEGTSSSSSSAAAVTPAINGREKLASVPGGDAAEVADPKTVSRPASEVEDEVDRVEEEEYVEGGGEREGGNEVVDRGRGRGDGCDEDAVPLLHNNLKEATIAEEKEGSVAAAAQSIDARMEAEPV